MPDLKANGLSRAFAFCTGLAIFGADRVTKYWVEQNHDLSMGDSRVVIPGLLDIVRSQNPGVAFGFLAGSTSTLRTTLLVLFSLAALTTVATLLWRIVRLDQPTAVGLSLIFGGALGNVFDRVLHGSVTDFIDLHWHEHHWYTFNLADSAITAGAVLILYGMMRPSPLRSSKVGTGVS